MNSMTAISKYLMQHEMLEWLENWLNQKQGLILTEEEKSAYDEWENGNEHKEPPQPVEEELTVLDKAFNKMDKSYENGALFTLDRFQRVLLEMNESQLLAYEMQLKAIAGNINFLKASVEQKTLAAFLSLVLENQQ